MRAVDDLEKTLGTAMAEKPSLSGVLAEIAETTSETLELQEVFERIARAVHRLIPLDSRSVVRIVDGQWVALHAISVLHGAPRVLCSRVQCTQPMPLTDWSPRLRPRVGPIERVDDSLVELDPAFPSDRRAIDRGIRSILWAPFRTADSPGGVWLNAFEPQSFTVSHEAMLRPIAALLGAAVEHWRIWDRERRRRQRLDRIETLLDTLAESLDVREVFQRLSDGMQPVLEHHLMTLTELDVGSRTILVTASAGPAGIVVPIHTVSVTAEEIAQRTDTEIVDDMQSTVWPDTERKRFVLQSGLRSWLRVPLWSSGQMKG